MTKTKTKNSFLSACLYGTDKEAVEKIRKSLVSLTGKNYLSAVCCHAVVNAKKAPTETIRKECELEGEEGDRQVCLLRFNPAVRALLDDITTRWEFASAAAAMRYCLRSVAASVK